jgi:hypothetical protein
VVTLAATVALAAVAPLPAGFVERFFSVGVYPPLQRALTGLSNAVPIALFDVLLASAVVAWAAMVVRAVTSRPGGRRWASILGHVAGRTLAGALVLCLVFFVTWGFNYRRVPLREKLAFNAGSVGAASAYAFAARAVVEANALHDQAHLSPIASAGIDPTLARAFEEAQRALGSAIPARPAVPKGTLLAPYFRAAGIDGMTDPFFLESLVLGDLLPVERAFVIAHEWAHLAGFADEGEANFVGWLTTMRGPAAARYSGWLFLYRELAAAVGRGERAALSRQLAAGPRRDLAAIADRVRLHVNPVVSEAGWRVYDTYLKANRVEAGTASYNEVVQLVLGASFGPSWDPIMALSSRTALAP